MHGLESGGPLALALFFAGLASGVHCAGMCGGIVTAFAMAPPAQRPRAAALRQLVFNLGRIASYALAGALAGALGGAGAWIAGAQPVQAILLVGANLMLVVVGLYLAGGGRLLSHFERLGAPLWRRLQPTAARLLPARTLPAALAAGALWGWIPCGLVYAALASAAFAATPAGGALAMLAFGAGTLPNLLVAGLAAARLRAWMARRAVRLAAGGLVLGFGVFGLARASGVADALRAGLLGLS